MGWCIFYGFLGILVGLTFAFWFTRSSENADPNTAKNWLIPITIGVLVAANAYCKLSIAEAVLPSTVYLVVFILSFFLFFGCILLYINKKYTEGKSYIRIMDVIMGSTRLVEKYVQARHKELDKYLSIDEYKEQQKQYAEQKSKAEYALKKLKAQEDAYKQQIAGGKGLVFELPIEQECPVTVRFMKALPRYANNYASFYHAIISLTESLAPSQKPHKKKNKQTYTISEENGIKMWEGFFFGLCHQINTTLFDTSKEMVRSHVRILVNGYYQKVVAVTGAAKYEYTLRPIPQNEGMIKAAYDNRTSLVKSQNIQYHYKGNNDLTWRDYLTFAVPEHEESGVPLVSIGISIANEELYGELLYLLNYLHVERIICEQIERLSKVYALERYIEKWRESNGTL